MTPRLLDLCCFDGGAAWGYHRAGFKVVGVDIKPRPNYPFEFHQADAIEFAKEFGHLFQAKHASPPCQDKSAPTLGTNRARNAEIGRTYPQLIPAIREVFMAGDAPVGHRERARGRTAASVWGVWRRRAGARFEGAESRPTTRQRRSRRTRERPSQTTRYTT